MKLATLSERRGSLQRERCWRGGGGGGGRGQLDPDSGQPAQREEAGLQTGAGDRSVSSGTACSLLLCFLDLPSSGSWRGKTLTKDPFLFFFSLFYFFALDIEEDAITTRRKTLLNPNRRPTGTSNKCHMFARRPFAGGGFNKSPTL